MKNFVRIKYKNAGGGPQVEASLEDSLSVYSSPPCLLTAPFQLLTFASFRTWRVRSWKSP